MNTMPELGSTARDIITGFTGVVIARTEWLNGCNRISLQPRELKDGKPLESQTFDLEQLEPVKTKRLDISRQATGGPRPEPSRHDDPK